MLMGEAVMVVAGAAMGLIMGSFLATIVLRWPRGQSVIVGRSKCDSCGNTLSPIELIPVLSYIRRGGRCRTCDVAINPVHPTMECGAALIGGVAMAVAPGWTGVAGAVFGWLLLTLAMLDLRHFWLPGALTAMLAISGVATGLAGITPQLTDRLWGGAAGFLSLYLIGAAYRLVRNREGLGGGDPKLLGAIGLWLGWQQLPVIILGASVVGLAYVGLKQLRGDIVTAIDRIPLGALIALVAFPVWLWQQI